MIIGQRNLLQKIDLIINKYPKFSMFVGPKNSGKRTIVNYICNKLKVPVVYFGCGIDEIRQIIELSYEQKDPVFYVCANADNMSIGAKNSLLKITEEPPNLAYFILTLENVSNTLETLQSRASIFNLERYTYEELLQYRNYRDYNNKYDNIIKDICTTTGEVDELFKYDIDKFFNFAVTIAEQIQVPDTGNIFKISKSVNTKDSDTGYDAILLFKTVRNLFLEKAKITKNIRYLYASNITTECLQDLNLPNLNKVATIDNWIFSVRVVLRG